MIYVHVSEPFRVLPKLRPSPFKGRPFNKVDDPICSLGQSSYTLS